ncbi:MAG TPA: sigma 54-interacting transcriptional regulator, partial [Blastocatellia bacterium]|nr:sigma 54-interacting transcriptional regulator [Blastocatellia bacterium]
FHACRALCHTRLGEIDLAVSDYERAVDLMTGSGRYGQAANYLNNIGFCLAESQRFEKGEEYLLQGLEVIQKSPVKHVEGALFDSLGYIHSMMENFDKAESYLKRATGLFDSSPDLLSQVASNLRLYAFHRTTRDGVSARAVAERSFSLAAGLGSQALLTEIRNRLAQLDLPEAARGSRLRLFHGMLYSAGEIEQMVTNIKVAARTSEPVLILGETGTGKELVARAIHRESNQSKGPFVAFNCSTAVKGLAESQLFGHAKGAFTDAKSSQMGVIRSAKDGTLFLDEIGDLELSTQAALLRFLQSGEVQPVGAAQSTNVRVRIVAATNHDLEHEAQSGQFRLDLFHRLNVITLSPPPLKNRARDIAALAAYFVEIYSEQFKTPKPSFSDEESSLLGRYEWPGNVRELENYAKRRVLFPDQAMDWLRQRVNQSRPKGVEFGSDGAGSAPGSNTRWRNLAKPEKIDRIDEALKNCSGNVSRAAKLLGISRRTIQMLVKNGTGETRTTP